MGIYIVMGFLNSGYYTLLPHPKHKILNPRTKKNITPGSQPALPENPKTKETSF